MLTQVKGTHEADALMQIETMVWGGGPSVSDNASSILKGAEILRIFYDESGRDWGEVLRHYHGIGLDSHTTDTEYRDIMSPPVINTVSAQNPILSSANTEQTPCTRLSD